MSIKVEVLGGSMIVQHYVEEIDQPDQLRLVSTSDVFTLTGRTKIGVIWDLAVKKIDVSEAHNRQQTPMFAKSIECHALRQCEIDRRKHATTHL
jgi:hypothetical protein